MIEILERAQKSSESAEVIASEFDRTWVTFTAGTLKTVERGEGIGVGLRVISGGRIGFSSTTDPSHIDGLVGNALASARHGQPAAFTLPNSLRPTSVKTADGEVSSLTSQRSIEELERARDAILSEDDSIHLDGAIIKSTRSVRIMNTAGLEARCEKTTFDYYLVGTIVEGQGILLIDEGIHSGRLRLDTDELVRNLLSKVRISRRICSVSTKRMPVLFFPRVLPQLLFAIELGVDGKQVQKGSSPLTGRIGEEIVDSRISIYDDGTVDLLSGSRPFDGEGLATRRTSVIDKGVLVNYLFDLQTGGILGAESTGNAQRDYSSPPWPGFNNVVMESGDQSVPDILAGIEEGIVIHQVLGGGQSNLLAGDFSLNVDLGFKVERGEIVGRVKNTMVAGNVYEALRNIRAVGDQQEEYGNFLVPAIAFDGLEVSSTA